MKSISLVWGANKATLSGPRSKQHRVRQNARAFAKRLRRAGFGIQKWAKISNKHFAAVAKQMKDENVGDVRITELFSLAIPCAKRMETRASARPKKCPMPIWAAVRENPASAGFSLKVDKSHRFFVHIRGTTFPHVG